MIGGPGVFKKKKWFWKLASSINNMLVFQVGGKNFALHLTELCGVQINTAIQVQIQKSTLAPFIQAGLLQLDSLPSLRPPLMVQVSCHQAGGDIT